MTSEQIKAGIDSGDMNIINGVISGEIKEISMVEESPQIEVQQDTNQPVDTPTVDHIQDEIEQARLYAEMVERRAKEDKEKILREKEDLLRKQIEAENKLKQEIEAKEEIANRLRQLEETKNSLSTEQNSQTVDEDDQYVSEFTKRTRQMVEELQSRSAVDDPVVKQMYEELNRLKEDREADIARKREIEEKEKQEKLKKMVYENITQFQQKFPELRTEAPIAKVNEEYERFRNDISYLSGARSVIELETAINEYYNNGKIKELADKNGVKPVQDYDKLVKIMELMDAKDGVKFNVSTGNYEPIVDEFGNQVRYKSIEEVYRLNNFYDEINKARKQAYNDVNKKLEVFNNAPVSLSNSQTVSVADRLTEDQVREGLNIPLKNRNWANDPATRELVERAYLTAGTTPPKSNRRF